MKQMLLALITTGSISVLASTLGLPDQDPIVKNLRDQFKKATLPTELQLKQGKTWFCNFYFAVKDDYKSYTNVDLYRFGASGSYLMNTTSDWVGEYVISEDGLSYVGLNTDQLKPEQNEGREFLRVTADGNIVSEYVVEEVEDSKLSHIHSAADPRFMVLGYAICPRSLAKDVHTQSFKN